MASSTEITIDLRELAGLPEDEITLQDLILDRAAKILLDRARGTYEHFNDRLKRIADEEIREVIRPVVQEAMERALMPTDFMGIPRQGAEPITLREHITRIASRELNPSSSSRPTIGGKQPLIEEIIHREVSKALREELKEPMGTAIAQITQVVNAEASVLLSEALQRALRRLA
jgi:hypothetical protein